MLIYDVVIICNTGVRGDQVITLIVNPLSSVYRALTSNQRLDARWSGVMSKLPSSSGKVVKSKVIYS